MDYQLIQIRPSEQKTHASTANFKTKSKVKALLQLGLWGGGLALSLDF